MKESLFFPNGVTERDIRRMSDTDLWRFLNCHFEKDKLRELAEAERTRRLEAYREYLESHIRYDVKELKPRIQKEPYSEDMDIDGEFFLD